MPSATNPLRLHRCLLVFALWLLCATVQAKPELRLSAADPLVDAWPAVTMLTDPEGTLDAAAVLARSDRFESPSGPHANLGVRRDVVWLRLALRVAPGDDGRWILDIDYPSLDRVDVYRVRGAQAEPLGALGDHLMLTQRPLPSRSHALALALEPGATHELLLRVRTTSSMIVPLRLAKVEAFHDRESRLQMLQGLATGICLCLLMYALANWAGSRDPMYLHYAVMIVGTTQFFFSYYGLAPQYLWPANAWLTNNMAPLAVLVALGGGLLLIERLLDVRAVSPHMSRSLVCAAVVSFAAAALFWSGLISYRAAHLTGTVLGPLPMLLAVRVAWIRWRMGDRAAPYVFVGWGGYLVGVAIMASLLRGWIGSSDLTQHAFQVASLFEALMWLRVLSMRNEDARALAERADRERQVLQALAHTDPLTGLPNRRGLEVALAAALPQIDTRHPLAVFLIDLDGFKAVNDRLGHDSGDELLVAVAARLRGELRHSDTVARLGGDEFVILAPGLGSEATACQLGNKLVAAFREPFDIRGQRCEVGLTIGFALAPMDGNDAASLLRRADAAMYAGKQSGKGVVRRGAASVGLAGA